VEGWGDLPGRLVVVSGPSGSGKSTLLDRALGRLEGRARLSVSTTTRAPRPGEREGVDYHFVSREEFVAARARGEFLEWAEFAGNLYGTPAGPVREALAGGTCVILEIDVQGALQVRARVPSAVLIFITVPSLEALAARLRYRGTESEETIRRRLDLARWELERAERYDERVLNEDLDRAVDDLVAVLGRYGCGG
jgi:guanylate kinase